MNRYILVLLTACVMSFTGMAQQVTRVQLCATLYNRVYGWSGLVDWKSGDTTSFSHIKQSWYDLERAMNMPTGSYEGLADRIAIAKDQGILPLVTINCGMSYIEPNAFVDGRLRLANDLVQLSDMALRRGATAAARKPYTLM